MRSAAAARKSSPFLSTEGWLEEEGVFHFLCAVRSHKWFTNGDDAGSQVACRIWHEFKTTNGERGVRVERQIKALTCIFPQSPFQSAELSKDTQHFSTSKMQLMETNCAIFSYLHLRYFEWIISTVGYSDM